MTLELPIYPWFDQVPDNLKTRNQLAELGLKPGGVVKARVVWRKGKRWADLYDLAEAKPKQAPTLAQLAALDKANEKRRTCPGCKTVFPYRWQIAHCPVCEERGRAAELAEVRQAAALWLSDSIILDTETTDLDGYLVQIAVIDTAGNVLLDTLVNPDVPIEPGAQRIHGITADQVASAPRFADIWPNLERLSSDHPVVVYNVAFDRGILWNEIYRFYRGSPWGNMNFASAMAYKLVDSTTWRCAMELYAAYVGDWSDYHGNYRWQPLPGGDHSALGDCRATLALLQRMSQEQPV